MNNKKIKRIDRVVITNFQVHKHLILDFSSSLTSIIGQSDVGKTAIIRAISWCLFNDRTGDDFITFGETVAEVKIYFDDGLCVTRRRGSGENSYTATNSDGLNFQLDNFGAGMVKQIIELHGMRPLDLFNTQEVLNICEQLSPPFFIGETPTNRALMIGQLAGADVIDLAIKNAATDLRRKKADEKVLKAKIKDVKKELKDYNGLSSFEKAIVYSEKRKDEILLLENKIENINSSLGELDELNKKYDECKRLVSNIENIHNVLDEITILDKSLGILNSMKKITDNLSAKKEQLNQANIEVSNIENYELAIESLNEAMDINSKLNNIQNKYSKYLKLSKIKAEIEKLKEVSEYEEIILSLNSIIEIMKRVDMLSRIASKLDILNSRLNKGEEVISKLNLDYDEAVDEYERALMEAKICPTCGAKTNKE